MHITALYLLLIMFAAATRADLIIVQEERSTYRGGSSVARVTTRIKGGLARIDRDSPPSTTIIDRSRGRNITLNHSKKTYRELSASRQKEVIEDAAESLKEPGHATAERPKIYPTGKKSLINGWRVEEYSAESASMKGDYWIARDLRSAHEAMLRSVANPSIEKVNQRFPDPRNFPGFPVVFTIELKTPIGLVKATTTVLSIKETPLPDSEFSIPKDYTRQAE